MKIGVAYTLARDLETVKKDLDHLLSEGFTHILHTYSEDDYMYNRERMREIIDLSADMGLGTYVSPRAIGRVFDGAALSEFAARNPEGAQIDRLGRSRPAACMNHESFQKFMRGWVEEICNTKAEVVFWDNPHFYRNDLEEETWSCLCETCQKLFRKKFHHLMPSSITKSVDEFRFSSILDFISELTGLVHRKGKRNSVFIDSNGWENVTEKLHRVAELPTVDELSIKPYWEKGEKPNMISKQYHKASKDMLEIGRVHKKEVQVWIKNFSIQKNNESSVSEATYAAYNEGVRNLFSWSYKGATGRSCYTSDDPEKVWTNQCEAFAECLEKAIMNEMVDVMKPKDEDD